VRHIDGVVWFDFEGICGGPRGAADYIEIALCHHTVLIGNIPSLDDGDNDRAKRLILLVDTLYDRRVKLSVRRCPALEPPGRTDGSWRCCEKASSSTI
jgi:cell division protein ZapE